MDRTNKKNLDVFGKVITSLATDAAADVEGISLVGEGRPAAVAVGFLPNERVTVDIRAAIEFNRSVPDTVAALQEKVKSEIESATKFKVHSINVTIVKVCGEN